MGYIGNIGALWKSDLLLYQPEDHRKRIAKELARYRKKNELPTVALLMDKYSLVEGEAKKLLASIKRKISKEEKAGKLRNSREFPTPTEIIKTPQKETTEEAAGNMPQLRQILQEIRTKYGDEIKVHGEQTTIQEGFIYLVTHCLFDGWVKAGMTIDFEQRLVTYNISDPLSRFKLSAVKWVSNRRRSECELLENLASAATESRGEWFLIDHAVALALFKEYVFD
jgi:hypothetical protein